MTESIGLSPTAVGRLMPMHVLLAPDGRIRRVGPTLQKLRPRKLMTGHGFLDLFEVRRPRDARKIEGLMQAARARLHLTFRHPPCTAFKGLIVGLRQEGALINLSFGIGAAEAVAQYGLTIGDFAPTDLTVEMLYLVEAKMAVMDETRKLNQRLQSARVAAEEQAFTDTLTGLKNRRAMEHVLGRLIEQDRPFGLMHLDLDYFKMVNDSLGHAAGDHVLQKVAGILVGETRREDTVARIGGDEFVIISKGTVDATEMDIIARRIIRRLEAPISYDGRPCRVSASIGITASTLYGRPDPKLILHDADMALYASKRAGRACVTMTDTVLKERRRSGPTASSSTSCHPDTT